MLIAVSTRGDETGGAGAEPGPAADARVVRLGEIVVVAPSEKRDLLETPTIESAALDIATSTVDADTIRLLDADTLTEALDLAPFIFTEKRGRKEKQLSSFRGQLYPYPDFALNGVWQRSFWEVPAFLPAAAIGRIEVLRSGGAIMVGPNSGLVGAINVVTRRFEERATLFDVQGGSEETFRSSVVHGNRTANADYTAGASFYSTAGPSDENAAEHFSSVFGTTGWMAADDVRMELTAFGLTGKRELRRIQDPGLKSLQRRTEQFSPYTSYGAILRTLVKHDALASTEVDIGYALRSGDYLRQEPGKADVEARERDWEYNAGVLHARNLSDANTLRMGLQYNHWICPDGKRFFVGKSMDVATFSGVVMDEQQWDRLTMDGGLRVSRSWYRDYSDTTFNIAGNRLSSRSIDDEWGDPAVTGTLGARYGMTGSAALYAHAAVGAVDAPPGAVSEGTDSLDRESRQIYDCGVSIENPAMGRISAGLFGAFRRDAVVLTGTSVSEDGETFNTHANNDVRQYGLELECRSALLLETFALFGNVTAMDAEISVNGDWAGYCEIPNVIAAAGVNVLARRFDVNLFGKYVSGFENKRFAEDGEYHDLGDFVDLNLTAGVSLGREQATRLYMSLENLLNDDYSTVVGFPDYGFQAYVGVQHSM